MVLLLMQHSTKVHEVLSSLNIVNIKYAVQLLNNLQTVSFFKICL